MSLGLHARKIKVNVKWCSSLCKHPRKFFIVTPILRDTIFSACISAYSFFFQFQTNHCSDTFRRGSVLKLSSHRPNNKKKSWNLWWQGCSKTSVVKISPRTVWDATCHAGSHSDTSHPTQVNVPRLGHLTQSHLCCSVSSISRHRHVWHYVLWKRQEIETPFQRTTNRKWHMGNPIVTLSVMSRDPVRSSYDPHMLTA